MFDLKEKWECFISYKTRGTFKRSTSGKARPAGVLNGLKNDPFYAQFVSLCIENRCFIRRENQGLNFMPTHVKLYHI